MNVVKQVGEASRYVFRSRSLTEITYGKDGKPRGFPILMANCLSTVADLCEAKGVDLEAAVIAKLNWNKRSTK